MCVGERAELNELKTNSLSDCNYTASLAEQVFCLYTKSLVHFSSYLCNMATVCYFRAHTEK